MGKKNKILNAIPPIGVMPPVDKNLEKQIAALSPDKRTLKNILEVIMHWEDYTMKEMKEFERKIKSYPVGV